MDLPAAWLRLDLAHAVEPPLEIRAEPDPQGGWHVRAERSLGQGGTIVLGVLHQTRPPYAVRVG